MASVWGHRLEKRGWSEDTIKVHLLSIAKSTRRSYDNVLKKCRDLCRKGSFPPLATATLAEMLHALSNSSKRPSSILHTATAALSHVYVALDMTDLTKDDCIIRLVSGLIKSKTQEPMKKSLVMPIEKFSDLFLNWGENRSLSLKQLRMKTIVLLALSFMLRPSDIAPKSTYYDNDLKCEAKLVFKTDMIMFEENGLKINFFGIKNDTNRTGFEVFVPCHENNLLDPKSSLQDYLVRTECFRKDNAVFLSLRKPYDALSASSIGKILDEAIDIVGLSGKGFTAKSFRPTGATTAIEAGIDPHIVQKVGRWKSHDVFFQHYVHSKTPCDYVSKVVKPKV